MNTGKYPAAVELALESCLPSEDPLDAKDFDPVAFVNEKFPDESSFARLEPYLAQLKSQIVELDVSIFDAVKVQSTRATKATEEISEAKQSILQLQNKIHDIKGKAEQSEVMVEEICRDIKKLDNAKRHLTFTITSLKRFHMLVTAVDQMEFMVENRQYQETANLLLAIQQLFHHFDGHNTVKSVVKLRDAVAKTKTSLTEQIFRDFEALSEVSADYSLMSESRNGGIGNASTFSKGHNESEESHTHGSSMFLTNDDPYSSGGYNAYDDPSDSSVSMFYSSDSHTPESLAGACAVVDALGHKVRRKLIEKVCHIWLSPYETLFGAGKEFSGLDHTERRFAWFRRILRDNEERFDAIFPKEWCINRHFLLLFVKKTEEHLKSDLRKIDPPDSADVSALVRSLRKTLDFEQEMSVRFEVKSASENTSEDGRGDQHDGDDLFDESTGERIDPMSAKGIKMRKEKEKKEKEEAAKEKKKEAEENTSSDMSTKDELNQARKEALQEAQSLTKIKGTMSSAFEPYLTAYVKLEANKMREELEVVIQEESKNTDDAHHLSSASNMFLQIQKSINRCIQFTTGQAFYNLYLEFKKVLQWYSSTLEKKLPKQGKPLTPDSVITCCFVCNSAEYCVDTVPQLQELIQSKINEAYRDTIDMEDVVDIFSSNLQTSIRAIVAGIHSAVEPDLIALGRTNWSTFQQVGDQSAYVSTLSSALREFTPRIREQLASVVYFRSFCSMFANSFIERFRDMVFRCKKVNDLGSQQLLLDTQAVKSLLLALPTLGVEADSQSSEEASFTVYTKHVTNSMHKVEMQLKLVSMNLTSEQLLENFKALLPDGNTEDLRVILEMKGHKNQAQILKKAEDTGVPKGAPPATSSTTSYLSSISEAAGVAGVPSLSSASSTANSFTNVFSKMSDMRETFDKVASTTTTSGAKGFSSLSATLQQYRTVNKKSDK